MKTQKEYQLELAQVYRNEMYCLLERVTLACNQLDARTNEELVALVGPASTPKTGEGSDTWLSGPLQAANRALSAIQVLNLTRFHELERKEQLRNRAREHFRAAKNSFRTARAGRDPTHTPQWWRQFGLHQLRKACDFFEKAAQA